MKLKDYYNKEYVEMLANKISQQYPSLDKENFISNVVSNIEEKEYGQRMLCIVDAFDKYLPKYQDTLKIFEELLGPTLPSPSDLFSQGWWLAPIGAYVEKHCVDYYECFDLTIHFIEEFAKRYRGEFAMKALLHVYPQRCIVVLKRWSESQDIYIRHLCSECMRISLPCAKKLTFAIEYFDKYREILSALRYDENPYVQRSIGNNLNDLYRCDKDKAQSIVNTWLKSRPTKDTLWISLL